MLGFGSSIPGHHSLVATKNIIDIALHVGSLAFAPCGGELSALTLTSASYAWWRAGVINTWKEVTVSIDVLRLRGVLAGFPAGHGLTPKVTLDFALATRIAGLIAATMLGIRWRL